MGNPEIEGETGGLDYIRLRLGELITNFESWFSVFL